MKGKRPIDSVPFWGQNDSMNEDNERGQQPEKKRNRWSVTFDTASTERIERMAGHDNYKKAEIIRHALALEDLYRKTLKNGGQFFIRYADGSVGEIVRP